MMLKTKRKVCPALGDCILLGNDLIFYYKMEVTVITMMAVLA